MTVALQTPFNSYTYAGTPTFAYTFQLDAATEVIVTVNNITKVLTPDYTVAGIGNQAGGTITYLSALTIGDTVQFRRNTPLKRDIDYQEGGELAADRLDFDIDRVVKMIQDSALAALIAAGGGGPTAPIITYLASAFLNLTDTFGSYTGRAGQYIRVNSIATGLESAALPAIISNFLGLSDTPAAYTGAAGQAVIVNPTATGLQFDGYPLGDGTWNIGADLVVGVSTSAQLAFSIAENDNLRRGSFNLTTGVYTSASGGRVLVCASAGSTLIPGHSYLLAIQKNGVNVAWAFRINYASGTNVLEIAVCSKQLSLNAGDTITAIIGTNASGGVTIDALTYETFLSIVELS